MSALVGAAGSMDRMYRRQRHIYDASRKFYLLGRDALIAELQPPPNGSVLEVACGTARNLVCAARTYPQARYFGFDISAQMLATAARSLAAESLSETIALAQGDATRFDPKAAFGVARFDRVFVSYALSMIPDALPALERALDLVARRARFISSISAASRICRRGSAAACASGLACSACGRASHSSRSLPRRRCGAACAARSCGAFAATRCTRSPLRLRSHVKRQSMTAAFEIAPSRPADARRPPKSANARPFAERDSVPRILVATDACAPQVNGVARTLEWLVAAAPSVPAEITLLTPQGFPSLAVPTYPALRLALASPGTIARAIERSNPDAIHIATEGPIGFFARRHCLRVGRPFTTCYHTRFPEYIAARWPVPLAWSYAALRRFHNAAAATMVSTQAMKDELEARGFKRLRLWRRGIPVAQFTGAGVLPAPAESPIFLYAGRVAVEKNLDAFLRLELPGQKMIVGDGPARERLQQQYPDALFMGRLDGAELARAYAGASVFVFPSLTDTFGLVMLEALAAGVPVAAFPVTGPREVLGESGCGVMDIDLRKAALAALAIPRERCRAFGARHTMGESAREFVANIIAAVGLQRAAV